MGDLKFMTKETTTIDKIHELAKQPARVSIDEVSHAFLASARVESWETLCEEFGGYKIGAIYAFVLGLIEQHISNSTSAREMAKEALFQQYERGNK